MIKAAPRYTAAQVILLAADDLMAQGGSEFSEWDLSLAAWTRDRNRFGMRGYQQLHPDHKRVMMEIMGRKPQNPLLLGHMEKLRPNTYRLTPLGKAEAQRMRLGEEPKGPKNKPSALDYYDIVRGRLVQKAFQRWREDPDEPKRYADVVYFLGGNLNDEEDNSKRIEQLVASVKGIIAWCNQKNVDFLTKDPSRLNPPIHYNEVIELSNFLQALFYRFPQLETPKKHKLPPKG
jgi:DNA-binding PadR family transcriptional regulator